jgi:hypothetical protein
MKIIRVATLPIFNQGVALLRNTYKKVQYCNNLQSHDNFSAFISVRNFALKTPNDICIVNFPILKIYNFSKTLKFQNSSINLRKKKDKFIYKLHKKSQFFLAGIREPLEIWLDVKIFKCLPSF